MGWVCNWGCVTVELFYSMYTQCHMHLRKKVQKDVSCKHIHFYTVSDKTKMIVELQIFLFMVTGSALVFLTLRNAKTVLTSTKIKYFFSVCWPMEWIDSVNQISGSHVPLFIFGKQFWKNVKYSHKKNEIRRFEMEKFNFVTFHWNYHFLRNLGNMFVPRMLLLELYS